MNTSIRLLFLCSDAIFMVGSFLIGIWLRFEYFEITHTSYLWDMLPVMIPVSIGVFWWAGLYNRTLRFTSIPDLVAVVMAVTINSLLKMAFIYFHQKLYYSRGILAMDWLMNLFFIGFSRIAPRILFDLSEKGSFHDFLHGESGHHLKRILIFGAGRAGESVAREMRRNPFLHVKAIGFIDDDPNKAGYIIHGLKVFGDRHTLKSVIAKKRIEEIIIAVPSATGIVIREIIKLCSDTRVRFKTIPGLQDMLDGKLVGLQLRDIAIEDLLRRPSAEINIDEIAAYARDKIILVTGAGGSIGSEICRQIMPFQPKKLLLLGQGENSIYYIHQELRLLFPDNKSSFVPIICNIQDIDRLRQIFSEFQPGIVFHAAAHKHVPLMECNPEEAVKNNVLGTRNLVLAAHESRVERFVMISTDKAVNPTSVMGVTKRIAEQIVKAQALHSKTRYVAVRFGNVLGSRGSVLPLFKRQIESGGPITITHPEMIRYFMTIPEASKLVIQAGAYGNGGEVFVLDMGEPVKILDLAKDLIRLAGLEEGKDIRLEFSGVRPGEKLYEELMTPEEDMTATQNKKIFVAPAEKIDPLLLSEKVEALVLSAKDGNRARVISLMAALVETYTPEAGHQEAPTTNGPS